MIKLKVLLGKLAVGKLLFWSTKILIYAKKQHYDLNWEQNEQYCRNIVMFIETERP